MRSIDLLPGFSRLVEEYDMLPSGSRVVCAVSGGADSMCLLHVLHTLAGPLHLTLHAAHYDHSLRGEVSREDAAFVARWCEEQGIPCTVGTGDVAAQAARLGRGVEETARRMRYAFLWDTAAAVGAQRLAVAHNASDNAETMLMHLVRGSALGGLAGMAPRRGMLIRPLLETARGDIEGYLLAHQVPHREDESNQSCAYTRNFFRHRVVPLLEEQNPQLVRTLCATARALRRDHGELEGSARALCEHARWEGEELVMDASAIAGASDAVALRCARLLLERVNEENTGCGAVHLEALVALCRASDPSGSLSLPHGVTARRRYGRIVLARGETGAPELETLAMKKGDNPIPGTPWTAVLAGEPWPGLVVRSRREGDQLTLPGRPEKSLKRLMIEEKRPRETRGRIPVAADGDGVVSVAGLGDNTAHPRYQEKRLTWEKRENKEGKM